MLVTVPPFERNRFLLGFDPSRFGRPINLAHTGLNHKRDSCRATNPEPAQHLNGASGCRDNPIGITGEQRAYENGEKADEQASTDQDSKVFLVFFECFVFSHLVSPKINS